MALLPGLAGARSVGLPAVAGMVVQRVHTDTRTLRPGDVFVALSGERFDAHDHLAAARAAGAVAAVAERGLAQAGLPGVEVPDSRGLFVFLALIAVGVLTVRNVRKGGGTLAAETAHYRVRTQPRTATPAPSPGCGALAAQNLGGSPALAAVRECPAAGPGHPRESAGTTRARRR